jgi:hypothetical protein
MQWQANHRTRAQMHMGYDVYEHSQQSNAENIVIATYHASIMVDVAELSWERRVMVDWRCCAAFVLLSQKWAAEWRRSRCEKFAPKGI